jgi:hypothetical protein
VQGHDDDGGPAEERGHPAEHVGLGLVDVDDAEALAAQQPDQP